MRTIKTLYLLLIPILLLAGPVVGYAKTSPNIATIGAYTPGPSPLSTVSPILLQELARVEDGQIKVLVETNSIDYSEVVNDINSLGGTVRFQFKYVKGLAATIPRSAILALASNEDIVRISLDQDVQPAIKDLIEIAKAKERGSDLYDAALGLVTPLEVEGMELVPATPELVNSLDPDLYFNAFALGATPIWPSTSFGSGGLVAIIDTGIFSGHFLFSSPFIDGLPTVVGGKDLSPDVGGPFEGFDSLTNFWHGSHVAGILLGHGAILLPATSLFFQSIAENTGLPFPDAPSPPFPPGFKIVPLFGIAPDAQAYVIKIFPHTGAGVPSSVVIAGIEHAIDRKTGAVPPALDIDVINMSLGGPTLFDGRDLLDQAVDAATAAGITVVSSAGNDGPARNTISSPGSAETGLAVSAAAHPVETRVFWDLTVGELGIGEDLFTSNTPQIIFFSSRGPTSDGRAKPDVASTGVFVLSACPGSTCDGGGSNTIAFVSGTSMSAPGVSGAIALLNAFADANPASFAATTPEDFKQAIKGGAIPLAGYVSEDQGSGLLNAANALAHLQAQQVAGDLGDVAPALPALPVPLADISTLPFVGEGDFEVSVSNLAPGFHQTFIFASTVATDEIEIRVNNVVFGLNNPLGINSLEVYVQSVHRTTFDYYVDSANVFPGDDARFSITDDETVVEEASPSFTQSHVIEPGFIKIVVENDWTSADVASADIEIDVAAEEPPDPDQILSGTIETGDVIILGPFDLEEGTVLELSWDRDWSQYPSSDIDMLLVSFTPFLVISDGVTLNSPERVVLEQDLVVFIILIGFEVNPPGSTEDWRLLIFD